MMDVFKNTATLLSRADVLTNLFLNPPETGSSGPDNSEWIIGTTQHIRWSTDFSNFDFLLFQQLACGDHTCVNGPVLIAENLTSETKTWDWQVTTGTLTLKPTNTFFLRMRDVNDEKNEFDSSTLDFTSSGQPAGGASSSVKSTSASTPKTSSTAALVVSSRTSTSPSVSPTPDISPSGTSSSTSPSATIASPTSTVTFATTSTAIPASSPGGGLSTGAKVGMMIGATSVVVIAIFLGWYLGRRRKIKSIKSPFHPFETPTPEPAPPVQLAELHVPGWGEQKLIPLPFTPRELHGRGKFDNFTGVRELDAWEKPSELGDGRRTGVKSGVYELGPRYT